MFTSGFRSWIRRAADVVLGRPFERSTTLAQEGRCIEFPEVVVPVEVYLLVHFTTRPRWPLVLGRRYEAIVDCHHPLPTGFGARPIRNLHVPGARTVDAAIEATYEAVRIFRPDVVFKPSRPMFASEPKGGGAHVRA